MAAESAGLVLFDGDCVLCNRSVHFLLAVDRRRRLRFASLQGRTAADVIDRHVELGEDRDTLVYVRGFGGEDERVAVRSEALWRIAWDLGGVWRLAAVLRVLPRSWRDGLYRWIARRRHAWFARHAPGRLPTPDERDNGRFLD